MKVPDRPGPLPPRTVGEMANAAAPRRPPAPTAPASGEVPPLPGRWGVPLAWSGDRGDPPAPGGAPVCARGNSPATPIGGMAMSCTMRTRWAPPNRSCSGAGCDPGTGSPGSIMDSKPGTGRNSGAPWGSCARDRLLRPAPERRRDGALPRPPPARPLPAPTGSPTGANGRKPPNGTGNREPAMPLGLSANEPPRPAPMSDWARPNARA